ncbi:MAG: helix-turn-helix transcriptional regulator [Candidatus Omnitrophica bacterium]|nr:helix-turn-helix transcriptional regulator [Candidatus Omnitrophota bacterium]MDE2221449.1 helix-turn-helix transcriptional regulator [Candidatus Omnitrophota bacterium]
MGNPKYCSKITGCLQRSKCPITNTLDLVGDKWTLLVIRDMLFLKKRSFNEFLKSFEGVATNILADRLKRLEEYGIIEKRPYRKAPVRYEYRLTKRGEDLRPLLMEMIHWGHKHIEGIGMPPKKLLEA